jgi:hypothetical protein
VKREAIIVKSSDDGKRQIAIDKKTPVRLLTLSGKITWLRNST